MIVGRAFCKIIDGMSIEVNGQSVSVKNNMGNQDALYKFIAESNRKGRSKYPLIFYVTNRIPEEHNGWKHSDTQVVIMMNTEEPLLYKERTDKTYVPYIEPIYQKLKKTLNEHAYIQVLGERDGLKYPYDDIPNYGITKSNVGDGKSKKSVVTDYVDARIIDLKFRIKTDCIN